MFTPFFTACKSDDTITSRSNRFLGLILGLFLRARACKLKLLRLRNARDCCETLKWSRTAPRGAPPIHSEISSNEAFRPAFGCAPRGAILEHLSVSQRSRALWIRTSPNLHTRSLVFDPSLDLKKRCEHPRSQCTSQTPRPRDRIEIEPFFGVDTRVI